MAIIKRVSYAITTFSGAESIKLLTTESKVKELTNKLFGRREFPLCLETIDDTHIEIAELNEYYLDCISRKSYFFLNVQAVYN